MYHGKVANDHGNKCFSDRPATCLLRPVDSSLQKVSHMSSPPEQDLGRTHGENESASKNPGHHDEHTSAEHDQQPSLSLRINTCLPEKLSESQHDEEN